MKPNLTCLALILFWSGIGTAALDDVKPEDKDQWLRVRVVAPTQRNVPSIPDRLPRIRMYAGADCRTFLFRLNPHEADIFATVRGQAPLALGSHYCIDFYVPVNSQSGRAYTILKDSMKQSLTDHTIKMKRVDVFDVTVTRPDESQYKVKGEYTLTVLNNQSGTLLGEFPTGTGIDVPSGFMYRVKVSAQTEDGPMSYTKDLDFRRD